MKKSTRLLSFIQEGIDSLLRQGSFDGGQPFRRTQKQALDAYNSYLNDENLSTQERLKGFFEIPTGVGKTAIFCSIIAATYKISELNGKNLKIAVVVPTRALLSQTQKSFKKFAPQLTDKIGLYGGGRRELGSPITIMTYNAWYDLSRTGEISSDNIDMLISDEAHKGTSERRIENIKGSFSEQTAQIAFTATAHFDETKSLRASHERVIYEKSIREAMLSGADELSSYVQGQTIVIRVEPTKFLMSDEFKEAALGEQIQYRRRIKQAAWNKYALKIFREGFDEHTQEPLTDNQAAFFVDGIYQAIDLEKKLNSDNILRDRAIAQGRSAVAMAIHSQLSTLEQERRFEAYQNGEYLAIIGDEMFKEGFDHAPLKTIIDYSHGSIVDKGQILGRGTRYWWNEEKNRSEGLTIIDTVVYVGSNVPQNDKELRKEALRRAVSVKEILGGSYVLGPSAPERKSSGYKNPRNIFGDDPNVEYYAAIEDVYRLNNEIDSIWAEMWKNNPLTIAQIKETIDIYREENKKNPVISVTEIEKGPLAGRISTWSGLNQAINNGSHGLNTDEVYLKWIETEKSPSLYSYLSSIGYSLGRVTLSEIKDSIDAFRSEKGQNPLRDTSGEVQHGPLSGKTSWLAISDMLSNGARGLMDDAEYQKFIQTSKSSSLAGFLIYLGYSREPLELSLKDIKESIDAYRIKKDGENPNRYKGNIEFGPLAGKTSWSQINSSLKHGANGLKDDPDYKDWIKKELAPSLPAYLIHLGYGKKREITIKLTLADIKDSIENFVKDNNGQTPSSGSSAGQIEVVHGPLAGKTNWQALSTALREGFNGLMDDLEYQNWIKIEDKPSLFTLCAHLGFVEMRKREKIRLSDVKEMIDKYREDNQSNNPRQSSGEVKHGALKGRTWSAVDAALKKGGTGLSEDDDYIEWTKIESKPSLTSYLAKLGYGEKVIRLNNLKLSDIWDSIIAYRDANTGRFPTQNDNIKVEHGPLSGKTSWMALSGVIKSGGNGLSTDPEYQKWFKLDSKPTFSKLCKIIRSSEGKAFNQDSGPS